MDVLGAFVNGQFLETFYKKKKLANYFWQTFLKYNEKYYSNLWDYRYD